MSLKDIQRQVHNWVQGFKVEYFKPLEIFAAIGEEFGELGRELNNRYGPRTKKSPEDTADIGGEITDIIFNLICLANSHKIDLDEFWEKKMDKCWGRDKNRFERKED